MQMDAAMSSDLKYRYYLTRVWNDEQDMAIFIGLNPSTADATEDDPTIRRCMGFARRLGCGGIGMLNLFAFRSTDPRELRRQANPISEPDTTINDDWISKITGAHQTIIACWGTHGEYLFRGRNVALRVPGLQCFGITKNKEPKHPLYLPAESVLMTYVVG